MKIRRVYGFKNVQVQVSIVVCVGIQYSLNKYIEV